MNVASNKRNIIEQYMSIQDIWNKLENVEQKNVYAYIVMFFYFLIRARILRWSRGRAFFIRYTLLFVPWPILKMGWIY